MAITKEAIVRRDSKRLPFESSLRAKKIAGLSWADWGVLLIFIAVGVVAVLHHVPGMDEAQGWLIARDLSVPGIVRQMHYAGTPPLWHLLFFLLIRLHLPYAAFGYVSLTMLGAAIYVWLRWSPLPFIVRLVGAVRIFLPVPVRGCRAQLLAFNSAGVCCSRAVEAGAAANRSSGDCARTSSANKFVRLCHGSRHRPGGCGGVLLCKQVEARRAEAVAVAVGRGIGNGIVADGMVHCQTGTG